MIVTGARSFERTSPVSRYWLAHCEGFVVRCGSHVLGAVAEVGGPDPLGGAEYLVLDRRPRLRREPTLVSTERVTAVVPATRTLVVEPAPPVARVRAEKMMRSSADAVRGGTPVVLSNVRSAARLAAAALGIVLFTVLLLVLLAGSGLAALAAVSRRRLPPAARAVRSALAVSAKGAYAFAGRVGPAVAGLRKPE